MKHEIDKYFENSSEIIAGQVSVTNLDIIAKYFGGSVKGTALPRKEQIVEIYNPKTGEEQRASVGDWIVKKRYWVNSSFVKFEVMSDWEFQQRYYPYYNRK